MKQAKQHQVMFLLMELYGTWLGNWAWEPRDPWLGLTSANPPASAGAFYCVLDMLVVTEPVLDATLDMPVDAADTPALAAEPPLDSIVISPPSLSVCSCPD